MAHLLSRSSGAYPSEQSVDKLFKKLNSEGIYCFKHYSEYSFENPLLAETAILNSELQSFQGQGYTFAYTGAAHVPNQGWKILVAVIGNLPPDFEQRYPQFVVVG